MTRKTTVFELEPNQVAAVNLLLAGKSATETAAELGLNRETIGRWRNSDAAFIAAMNSGLLAMRAAGETKLIDAQAKAIDKLAGLLECGDKATELKAAAILAKMEPPRLSQQTEPEQVARSLALRW